MLRALLPLVAAGLLADEITLQDGRVLEGDLLSEPGATEVVLRFRSGTMVAIQRFKADQVQSERRGLTPRQAALAALDARQAALGEAGEATAWWDLATAYRAQGEGAQAKACAQAVVARDPDHAEARALLGWVRHEDRWLRPAEAALARGDVWFRGRWTPVAERDAVLAEEARAATEAEARAERRRAEDQAAEARRQARRLEEPPAWVAFGQVRPVPSILLRDPHRWACTPAVAPAPSAPGLQVQAEGQHGNTRWSLDLNR